MPIAQKMKSLIGEASWIRKMFEESIRLKKEKGAQVYNFSLGNPIMEPPEQFFTALQNYLDHRTPARHRYMDNMGLEEPRAKIAAYLQEQLGIPFTSAHVALTVGAGGGLNTVLKTLSDPGDEVIIIAPYFGEYLPYIDNHGAVPRIVMSDSTFDLDVPAIAQAIDVRTKAIIVNSPNNPSGRVYSAAKLRELATMLEQASQRIGHPIYMISDEPYTSLLYTKEPFPAPLSFYRNTIMVTSLSKTLSIPGERIGYLIAHPQMDDCKEFMLGAKVAIRILGFVNAPAIMQHILPQLLHVKVNVDEYRQMRDILVGHLQQAGYKLVVPEGTFYIFPQAPGGDDVKFINFLKDRYHILTVPGVGFGYPGCFRIAYCVDRETLQGALPGFAAAIREFTGK